MKTTTLWFWAVMFIIFLFLIALGIGQVRGQEDLEITIFENSIEVDSISQCGDEPIRVYACNWTERELDVMVLPDPDNHRSVVPRGHFFTLRESSTMNKPSNYTSSLVPNCFEMYLVCGHYDVYFRYVDDQEFKTKKLKVCARMPQPIELDFEEE